MPLLSNKRIEPLLLELRRKLLLSTSIAEYLCLHHHRLTWRSDDRPIRVASTIDQRGRIKQHTTYHIRCSQCHRNYVMVDPDVT